MPGSHRSNWTSSCFRASACLASRAATVNPLADILRAAGLQPAGRIGVAGWKYFGTGEGAEPGNWLEVPSYIVDVLRQLAGERGAVVNETALVHGFGERSQIDQRRRSTRAFRILPLATPPGQFATYCSAWNRA